MWPSKLFRFVDRLIDALSDPARRERTAVALLACYALVWTLYAIIAKSSQDIHYDSAELVTWSREPSLGYTKHPPLASWLVHAWFSVFPVRDWSYYLLAMVYATIGLWIAWRLFERYLDPDKRIVALACLTFVPYFNFHGLRFDHNSMLGPLWAATTLCFIRSFETRSSTWAALAGAAAAASMLGKYWSIFLLAGLVLAALADSRRRDYFRSAAPWITIVVGAIVLAPHVAWLVTHDFIPLTYAIGAHDAETFGRSVRRTANYLAGGLAYAAAPALITWIPARPDLATLGDTLWPRTAERRLAAMAFWIPFVLPAVVALTFEFDLSSLWTMCGFTLLPVVLLSSPLLKISRQAVTAIVAFAIALPTVMLAMSPFIAIAIHLLGVPPTAAYAKLLAERINDEWRQTTDRPLRIVGGDLDLAYVEAFYLPDQPIGFPVTEPENTPWITPERIDREGAALVCDAYNDPKAGNCRLSKVEAAIDKLVGRGASSRRLDVVLTRSYLGIPGTPERFMIVILKPKI